MYKKILSILFCGVMFAMSGCVQTPDKDSGNTHKSSLPDYDAKANELTIDFAGWVMPKEFNEEHIDYIRDSGISVLQFVNAGAQTRYIDFRQELSQENKQILKACEQNGFKALLHISGKDDAQISNVKNVKNEAAVAGICYDEPNKDQINAIATRVSAFNSQAGNVSLFTNLYPSVAPTVAGDFGGDYKLYLKHYCNSVLNKLTAGEKWLSADRYPLTYNGKGEPCLDTGWLADVEAVALTAREYDGVKTNFFIQTMPYSSDGNRVGSRDRVPSYEDIRLQEYTLVAFGYDMISLFCYATPAVGVEFSEKQTAMIDRSGNRTQIYYDAQKANREILAFDHVVKQFDWKGVFTCDAGVTSSAKERTKNSSFSNLTNRMSIASVDCLKSVTASADTLFGYFLDKEENDGFMIVNYNDSSAELSDGVTLNFDSSYGFNKALCYIGGEKKILNVKDNALTLDLGVGEGVFVVPYAE